MAMSVGKKPGGRKTMAEINITPFTDVCLVLLIIFMVSASFMGVQRGLDVKLPAPSTDTQQDNRPTRDVTILLAANGAITVQVIDGDNPVTTQAVPDDQQLIGLLSNEATVHQVKTVTVLPDNQTLYSSVVGAIDAVKEAGISFPALAVQAPSQPDTASIAGSTAATPSAAGGTTAGSTGATASAADGTAATAQAPSTPSHA